MIITEGGKKAYKVGLHIHTERSDGHLSYEDAIRHYKEHGYDCVAITDHWRWSENCTFEEVTVLSGAEYNIGGNNGGGSGVYHILGIGCTEEPDCAQTDSANDLVRKIHKKGGIAVLAHPAWSLNTPEMLIALEDVDMTEIYNTVSTAHESDRPYSGLIIDMAASRGKIIPIDAADDSHYYDGTDSCIAYVMVYAKSNSREDIMQALKSGDFYSTLGPYVDIKKDENGNVIINTSPVSKIAVHSNIVWANEHVSRGEGLTSKVYTPKKGETFVRVEATDADGKTAFSNIIKL